jgi:WD40 repeat protein
MPGLSTTISSQHNSSNDNSQLGKRALHVTGLEPENKRAKPNPLERRSINEPNVALPAGWSIIYTNSQVPLWALDVSWVRSLEMKPRRTSCTTFSKDGKYLAVGFEESEVTKIYDVQTGGEFRLVSNGFF